MGLFGVFTKNAALDQAEASLHTWEDKLFQPIDGEDKDLAIHARADVERFQALNLRARVDRARAKENSDRNLVAVLIGFSVLAAKLFGFLDPLLKLLGML